MAISREGEITLTNASQSATRKAQLAFAGAAEEMNLSNDEEEKHFVNEMRYGKE